MVVKAFSTPRSVYVLEGYLNVFGILCILVVLLHCSKDTVCNTSLETNLEVANWSNKPPDIGKS